MNKNEAIIYQIFVRNHSDDGSISEVVSDLERLKNLGVDIVYLMPINEIGVVDRKGTYGSPYASKDYFSISRDLGSLCDLRKLIDECHKLGMKIILDMVFNHTSPDSVLVSEHPEYYFYKDGKRGGRIADWSDIVDLDTYRNDTQEYLLSVLAYWLKQGFDGFRFDVCTMIPLPFFKKAREKFGKEIIFFGESVEPSFNDYLKKQGLYASDDEDLVPTFDYLYNYNYYRILENFFKYGSSLTELVSILNRSSKVIRVNCLENHDNERIAKYVNGDVLYNMHAFSFFLKGHSFLYACEEYGNKHKPDLFEKDPIDWTNKDDELCEFIKKLIFLKHSGVFHGEMKAELINDYVLHISRDDLDGYFKFKDEEITIALGNDEYIDILSNNTYGDIVSLTKPLILKRVRTK